MKAALILLMTMIPSTSLLAQYQKMVSSSVVSLSGSTTYANVAWSKQLTSRTMFTISGLYFRDETRVIKTDNFGADLGLSRWLLRFSDVYVGAGLGGYMLHTNAESAAGSEADDLSFGLDLRGEIEFYPLWWLVMFGEVKQLVFVGSDFFNRKFILGGGIKFVF